LILVPDTALRHFRLVRILAVLMLVVAPAIYLIIAYSISAREFAPEAGTRLFFIGLLIIAVVEPVVYPLIERFHLSQLRGRTQIAKVVEQLYVTLSIIKMALVEAIYIYGLVAYLVTRHFDRMLYFYPVGIVWSVVYWPTRGGFERFLSRGERL
jgi:F0F1-type ATP synthase membrane subunit c/vacuolar-type H+-ATPase subunit K